MATRENNQPKSVFLVLITGEIEYAEVGPVFNVIQWVLAPYSGQSLLQVFLRARQRLEADKWAGGRHQSHITERPQLSKNCAKHPLRSYIFLNEPFPM